MNIALLICLILGLPALTVIVLGISWLLGVTLAERLIARLTKITYGLTAILTSGLWIEYLQSGQAKIPVDLGHWFALSSYNFPLSFMIDGLSLPLITLSVILVGVVAVFSTRYLHRDPGYFRFFLLLNLFGFGILLLFSVGSFDLLIAGWEIVGLTSVLLIAFFQFRDDPVKSALRVFATYRTCDIGLLVGVVLLHHFAGIAQFSALVTTSNTGKLSDSATLFVGLLFLLAAMGKAAQVPFSGWLPRAMEGPTPSSAIFYGALSVHAGAYLLLRAYPLFAQSAIVRAAVILVGITTAIHGTFIMRVCPDAKSSLAYAAMTQLGIIFVEIGCGFTRLALLHICGHAVVRTLQFLRAPSMLHDFHRVHAAAGGHIGATGAYYEQLLPRPIQTWLYRLALDRGHHDTLIERFVITPIYRIALALNKYEFVWIQFIAGQRRAQQIKTVNSSRYRFNHPAEDSHV